MRLPRRLILFMVLGAPLFAQTLYVPGGTNGIGNNLTNGNVGIGTTSPTAGRLMDVEQTAIDGYAARFSNTTGVRGHGLDVIIGATDRTAWGLSINGGASRLYGDGGAYFGSDVGIGTTTPGGKFHVVVPANVMDFTGATALGVTVDGSTGLSDYSGIDFRNSAHGVPKARIGSYFSNFGSYLQFGTSNNYGTGITNTAMTIDYGGNVGIGTTTPGGKFHVVGPANVTAFTGATALGMTVDGSTGLSDYSGIDFRNSAHGVPKARIGSYFSNFGSYLQFGTSNNYGTGITNTAMTIDYGGNVGIGTTNPGAYKLAVNGTMHAKEVVVDTAGWSDYVFDESYRLKALSEVEAYVKIEKHLPGIPSAQEVAEHGVSMGDMQSKLLAKIEELTLHLIAQEKNQFAQEKRLIAQQAEIVALRNQLTEISQP
jgi:hypothetical protein